MSDAEKLEQLLALAKRDKDRATFMQVYELNDVLDLIPPAQLANALLPIVFDELPKTLKNALSGLIRKWGKTADGISGNAATYEIRIMFYSDDVNYEEFHKANNHRFYLEADIEESYKEHAINYFNSREFLNPIKEAFRKHIAKEFPDLKINFGIYPQGKIRILNIHMPQQPVEMYFKGHLVLL